MRSTRTPSLANGEYWEIQESDHEIPDADPNEDQDDVPEDSSDDGYYDYRRILKYFQIGHGLLQRAPSIDQRVNQLAFQPPNQVAGQHAKHPTLESPPATNEPSRPPISGGVKDPAASSANDEPSESTSTRSRSSFGDSGVVADKSTPATEGSETTFAGKSLERAIAVTASEQRHTAYFQGSSASDKTDTSSESEDRFPFTQNPPESSNGDEDAERAPTRAVDPEASADHFDASIEPANPLDHGLQRIQEASIPLGEHKSEVHLAARSSVGAPRKEYLTVTESETSSDDELGFTQNPLSSPPSRPNRDGDDRVEIEAIHLPLLPDTPSNNVQAQNSPDHDRSYHGQLQTTLVREQRDRQPRDASQEKPASFDSARISSHELRKSVEPQAKHESEDSSRPASSYVLSLSPEPEVPPRNDLADPALKSDPADSRSTGQDDDTLWSITTTESLSINYDPSSLLAFYITPETDPPPTKPVPTKRITSPTPIFQRCGLHLHPWSTTELDPDDRQSYATIIAKLHEIREVEASWSEELTKLGPLQFPNKRSKIRDVDEHKDKTKSSLRYCRCRKKTPGRRDAAHAQRCFDPACEVLDGWHHLDCLTDIELQDVLSMEHWICRPCIARRKLEGFPELLSDTVNEDRRRRLVRLVLGWAEKMTLEDRVVRVDGLTGYKRVCMRKVDRELRRRKLWPKEGDKVLCMYLWWVGEG